jgi:hypothetical protein
MSEIYYSTIYIMFQKRINHMKINEINVLIEEIYFNLNIMVEINLQFNFS